MFAKFIILLGLLLGLFSIFVALVMQYAQKRRYPLSSLRADRRLKRFQRKNFSAR